MKKRKKILKRSFALILSMTMFFSFSLSSFALYSETESDAPFDNASEMGFFSLRFIEGSSGFKGYRDDILDCTGTDIGNIYENFEEDYLALMPQISNCVRFYNVSFSEMYSIIYCPEDRSFVAYFYEIPEWCVNADGSVIPLDVSDTDGSFISFWYEGDFSDQPGNCDCSDFEVRVNVFNVDSELTLDIDASIDDVNDTYCSILDYGDNYVSYEASLTGEALTRYFEIIQGDTATFVCSGQNVDGVYDLDLLKTLCESHYFSDYETYVTQHTISGNDVSGDDSDTSGNNPSGNNPSGNNPSGGNDNNHTSRLFDFNVSSLFYYTEAITDSLMVIVYIAGGFALGFGIINMLKNAFKLR